MYDLASHCVLSTDVNVFTCQSHNVSCNILVGVAFKQCQGAWLLASCICIVVSRYACMHESLFLCVYKFLCVFVRVYVHACVCVCLHACVPRMCVHTRFLSLCHSLSVDV